MPGWDGYPVGPHLERHFGAPAWVDNDANLMALGAWDRTRHIAGGNVVLIKAGTGIGAGILSRGRLHRGARGAAGDFGHVVVSGESGVQCRCGLFGCLEALAGGWALARDARDAVYARRSTWLQRRLDETGTVTGEDVIQGCLDGDAVCEHLITRSGTLIGQQLATLVSILNPSTVFLAGSLVRSGPRFLDAIASAVKPRALVLATDELLITPVPLNHYEGVIGGATLAADELFAPGMLARWLANGTPRGLSAGTCIAADTATELPPMRQRTRLMAELSEARNG
jgi:predicted NBD/HSP70 family sugar kinase